MIVDKIAGDATGGGTGGGGTGGTGGSAGSSGTANLGGGGANMATGGSGVVILKIPSVYIATFSVGLTVTANTTATVGFRIYSVTAGTGTVSFST